MSWQMAHVIITACKIWWLEELQHLTGRVTSPLQANPIAFEPLVGHAPSSAYMALRCTRSHSSVREKHTSGVLMNNYSR